MAELVTGLVGPGNTAAADNTTPVIRLGKTNEVITSGLHPTLYEAAYRQKLFYAYAAAQTLTAAGTVMTGLVLWNGSSTVNLHLVKIGLIVSATSASMTGIALAATSAGAQTAAPSSTAAITKAGSTFLGQASSGATAYTAGTTQTNTASVGLMHNTAAINTVGVDVNWIDLSGFIVPPLTAVALAALGAASASSAVTSTIMWEEIPI